jgi:predicted nucleic-acid-binding Zn-ribbon protein
VFRVYDAATGASASTLVDVQVKTFVDGQVRPIYCGYTEYGADNFIIAENDNQGELYTNPNVPVTAYGFQFVDQLTQEVAAEVIRPNAVSWIFLGDAPGLEFGKIYDVSVKHTVQLNGNGVIANYWSDYGTSCPIGLEGLLPVKLRSEYCPSVTPLYLDELVKSKTSPGADLYEFTFDGGGESFVKYKQNNYQVSLATVGTPANGLKYGVTYDVQTRARVNGNWTPEGDICQITMASEPPQNQLSQTSCSGGPYEIGLNPPDVLRATPVAGTYRYHFRFIPVGGGTRYFKDMTSYNLPLGNNMSFLTPGDWLVDVRIVAGGMTGTWGPACTITIGGGTIAHGGEGDDLTSKWIGDELSSAMYIYPNPNSGEEFVIELQSDEELLGKARVEVLDMTGREVYTQQAVLDGKQGRLKVRPTDALGSGVYTIRFSIGEKRFVNLLVVE